MSHSIRIVLVGTTHPGNLGASARAMQNMGLDALVLVRPAAPLSPDAEARAAGGAEVLRSARIEPTVEAAVADCGLVLGATARPRRANWRVLDARAAAAALVEAAATRPAAVVFGGERNGLANDELARCHALLRIPADARYASLNLAQAVQVVCYEVFLAAAAGAGGAAGRAHPPATAAELGALEAHAERVLARTGFLHAKNAAQLRERLSRLLARAVPDEAEVRILRGALAAVERALPPAP